MTISFSSYVFIHLCKKEKNKTNKQATTKTITEKVDSITMHNSVREQNIEYRY